jgi:hypothetical protein
MELAAMSLGRECPAAVLSDRPLRLPTFSHLLTVKKRPPSPPLSSAPPFVSQCECDARPSGEWGYGARCLRWAREPSGSATRTACCTYRPTFIQYLSINAPPHLPMRRCATATPRAHPSRSRCQPRSARVAPGPRPQSMDASAPASAPPPAAPPAGREISSSTASRGSICCQPPPRQRRRQPPPRTHSTEAHAPLPSRTRSPHLLDPYSFP